MVHFSPRPPVDVEAIRAADAEFRRGLDELAETQRAIDALEAHRARQLVGLEQLAERLEIVSGAPSRKAFEFVLRSLRAEVGLALHCSEYAADRMLIDADTLVRTLPGTLDAVESGLLPWRAAAQIAEQARELRLSMRNARVDEDTIARSLAAYETEAMRIALLVAPSRLRTRLIALRERHHVAPAVERHRAAREERRVTLEDADDGMSWLSAFLPSVEAHAIYHRLTDVSRAAAEIDAEDGIDGPETLDQRRVDLLVAYLVGDCLEADVRGGSTDPAVAMVHAERRTARGVDIGRFAGIRPTIVVTVPVETLLGRDGADPPMLDGVVPIDPATARELAANAPGLYRMLVDPHTGVRLDLGRERYAVSTELRMWLRLRDETCRFPGCGRLAKGCDVDHSLDWQYGGETRAENLAHLCRGHHTLKHRTRWQLEQHPSGEITWRSPSGRKYSTWPAAPFARAG